MNDEVWGVIVCALSAVVAVEIIIWLWRLI